MTAAADARRRGRDQRRGAAAGARPASEEAPRHEGLRSDIGNLPQSAGERVRQMSPPAAAVAVGAAVGVFAGLAAAAQRSNDDDGNVISGEVAVHLLKRIELLTIRLHVRHARRGLPTAIDVHRVETGS